ncbi:uncharacterized protein LOC111354747 [Spodoptera litura]|uniref:Uncharacterized protein LOC111354747 n=1 Tax=Spodoptera litura TaxID=69820 RepID=A0A9J7E8C5_SPOLT|nr:uncharacterized protein LOC111354747 [Spodoptera litura]
MENLELQSTCFENIKSLCVNYRKDSASRKTLDYLNKRLASLENQWKDFDSRHTQLVRTLEDKTINYFTDNIYEKTEEMYLKTKADIIEKLSNWTELQQKVQFNLTGTAVDSDVQASSDDKIQLLINKQACHFNAINSVIAKINSGTIAEKWELDDHLTTLKAKWDPIDKLHWEIDFELKGSNQDYYKIYKDVEQKYDETKKRLNSKIWSTDHYSKSAPKMAIPEFSGSYSQWISFKDLFIEAIHKNPVINNAQKMQHLKTKLRGEAERLVQHLSISADNYNSCWEILNQRYDNRRLQFTSFMNTMLDLPVIQNPDAINLKRMHDVITECLNGISNIGVETASWDPMIVHVMSQKLDSHTLSEYMKEIRDHREIQNLPDFLYFLETRFMAYETMKSTKKGPTTSSEKSLNWKLNKQNRIKKPNYLYNKPGNFYATKQKCPHCNGSHVLMQCDKFLGMDISTRNNTVSKLQLCKNCLYSHGNEECKSTKNCRECNLKHHTLLHTPDKKNTVASNRKINYERASSSSTQQHTSNHVNTDDLEVLLTTVQLKVQSIDGTYVKLRALLDQGSQVNLITENAAQLLRLPRSNINACITGIGTVSGDCRGQLNLTCKSIHSDYCFTTQALIMKKLTHNLPTTSFEKVEWPHLENLKLADPDYNISSQIDLLLGADVYSEIILDGVMKGKNQTPVAQQTLIGWILCGKMKTFNCNVALINMNELTKFWDNENIQLSEDISKDDQCEKFYTETVTRAQDGTYTVKMPLCDDFEKKLGNSRSTAVSQFLQLEKRLKKNPKLSAMYEQFIEEYIALGHMKLSPHATPNSCYLPHHGVLRENSTTTKLRVVFNASQRTTSGYSLNSLMEKGANLQQDIQALILKWRTYKYVFTADIEKMYRCIWLSEEQQELQKIIWRGTPDEALRDYQLCTVTYGTKCAPWLAMRTLKQIAMDDGHKYPEAAKILQTECYVDDVISGHNCVRKAQQLQLSLIQLLRGAGMNLRKWSSNHPALLENLHKDQISTRNTFDFKSEETSKTLGLCWDHKSDTFHFNWPVARGKHPTKRSLLSEISKFYDPLGWLSPITVKAKLLFQKLWITKLGWDEQVPSDIATEWLKLNTELTYIKSMKLNRWIGDTQQRVELLGFCDASEKAYACVIYSRVTNEQGSLVVTLLVAKTRVAPLTQKTTVPRLELCGALLLAELMQKTREALDGFSISVRAWTDSQVVLAWIQGDSSKWETYVANRVTKIKHIIPATQWNYVKSEYNPADCASRGLLPSKLLSLSLWWQGPDFLSRQNGFENNPRPFQTNMGCANHVERKQVGQKIQQNFISDLLNNCSSLTHITRITAWIQRFINNMRNKTKSETDYLTASELSAAEKSIVMYVQRSEFDLEYKQLNKNEDISKKSSIFKLNPYLDENGIICVGGRLKNSSLPPKMKNPSIIPHTGRYTKRLIDQAHSRTLHGGARLTSMYLRQRYWIVGGNRAIKMLLRKCVRCHRFSKSDSHQLMADLPRQRVTPCRPFTHTGVDFSGHVNVKHNKGRGIKTSKGYIAIFICMATKAVHIELVSDLSTETFIAAFQRLCARRGTPKHMYSDCGTNFIGAARLLREEYALFKQVMTPEVFSELANLEVEWHFNAPAWPSAGGLWEAAVKSMKHHLRRVLGDQKLTYEEFSTLLAKIEACLNSRPLCPLTEDPEEFYNCLTPGHFLTGSPILSLPLADYSNASNINLRRRWQLCEHMFHQYWKTWSNEYLTTLQTRSKWNKPNRNIKKGDLVLVKEDNLPPGKWAMGRIIETHPGSDGYVRVTTVKTQAGNIKRPVVKLSPLPLDTEIQAESETEKTNTTRHRAKGSKLISTLFITTLTLFTLISGVYGATDTTQHAPGALITELKPERPVYYDTVGKMQVIHDEWILIMYYNLTNYWESIHRTETFFENVKNVCYQTKLQHCQTIMEQLSHEMELLSYYNSVLMNPHKHLSNRKRRGLVDGVGYIANSLFGILDQHFAEKYQNDINSIQNNEKYLLDLIKNQTTIVELENQVLKKSETNIKRQFNIIDSFVNQTNLNLASIETEMEIISATTYINSASLTAYLLINSLQNFQEMLFNTLTNVYQGHIDVHLITPVHLIEQLGEISGNLPKTVSLPVENYKENIKEVYKLMNVKARVTETYFIFEVHIPLVSNEDYMIYQVIPLPFTRGNQLTYAQISSKYIAVNLKKSSYILLTEGDYRQCVQQTSLNFLCKNNLPSYDLHSNKAPCEAKLLSHQNTAPCDIAPTICKDAWIELHSSNSWLAICCDTCVLRTLCSNDITTYTLKSSGLVTLSQGCVLQSRDITIVAHRQYNSQTKMNYALTAPTLNTPINKIVNLTYRYAPNTLEPTTTDLEFSKIEGKIKTQKDNEANLPSLTTHDIHQYAISYSLLSAAIVALLLAVGRKRWSHCFKKNPTTVVQHEDIELQVIRQVNHQQRETGGTLSSSNSSSEEPRPVRFPRSVDSGTRNIAFNLD